MRLFSLATRDLDLAALGIATLSRNEDALFAAQVLCRERFVACHDLFRGAARDHFATVFASTRTHVDHVVGTTDRILVVFDHEHRVAQIAQMLERFDEALVIALMKADGGLVEDIEHTHKACADLCRKTNALRFATRKRGGRTFKREVTEAHVHQETQALGDLLHDRTCDHLLRLVEMQPFEELQRISS